MMTARRTLLACLPVALAPAAAHAFRLEPAPAEATAEYEASACAAPQTHEALRIELDTLMEGRPVPQEALPRLGTLARCPFCGCSVLGAADHGEGPNAPG